MSSSLYYAANSAVGGGTESTYGTAVARSVWCFPISSTLRPNVSRSDREFLRSSATSFNTQADFISSLGWSGNLTLEMTYDNCGFWLRHLIGSSATTGPTGSIYQHTYKRSLAFQTGITLEVNRGTTAKDLFTGGKIARGTISHDVTSRSAAKLSLDLMGTTFARSDSAATVTGRTNETRLDYHHASGTAGNINWNSITPQWKNWTLSIDNGLDPDRRFNGSLYMIEPLRQNREQITVTATIQVTDTMYDAYVAGSSGDLTITYDDPNSLKDMIFTVQNAKIVDLMDSQIDHMGQLMSTVTWKGFTDGAATATDGIQVVVDNLTSTAFANG